MALRRIVQRKTFIAWFAFVLGAIALVAGVKGAHRIRERRLQALFAGPCEAVSETTEQRYYPR